VHKPRRTRRTIAVVVALTLAMLAGFVVSLAQLGIPLLPATAAAPAPPAPSPAALPIAKLSDSPAVASMRAILSSRSVGGYSPEGTINWAVGTPYDYACRLSEWKGAGSAVSAQRSFIDPQGATAPSRPSPSPAGSTGASPVPNAPFVPQTNSIVVSLHAYGAGAGAANFEQLIERINSCPQRDASVASDISLVNGADAVFGRVRPEGSPVAISTLTWRRGDVILDVHSVSRSDSDLADFAAKVDDAAVRALNGACATISSSVDDGRRSPWVDRDAFTGLVVHENLTVTPGPVPAPPAGVAPRDPASSLAPIPSVTLTVTRPADPIWPTDLPTPVAIPVAPSAPAAQPTSASVDYPAADPIGPGCGWKFTAQLAPAFDSAAADASKTNAQAQASNDIAAGQQAWSQALVAYWVAASAYDQGLLTYTAYANQVRQVVAAWNAIQQSRDTYAAQFDAFSAATAVRDRFVAEQKQAMLNFQNAVTACLTATPSTSTSTTPATPTDVLPSPTGATPTPTTTPSPTVTTPPPPATACPPQRPQILDQPVPTVPPSPLPPSDPRPSVSPSPTR